MKFRISRYENERRISVGVVVAENHEEAKQKAAKRWGIDLTDYTLTVDEVKPRVEVMCAKCKRPYRGKAPARPEWARCPLCTAKLRVWNRRNDYLAAVTALQKLERKQGKRS